MLEHIGITINEKNDINAFYKDLLGLKEERKFELYEDVSEKLFGTGDRVPVALLSGEDFFMEVFLTEKKQTPVYNHICISIEDRNDIIQKAKSKGFPVTRIERESRDDIVFLRDRSGNIFEIKDR